MAIRFVAYTRREDGMYSIQDILVPKSRYARKFWRGLQQQFREGVVDAVTVGTECTPFTQDKPVLCRADFPGAA